MEKVVESIFARMKEQPGESLIAGEFEERIAACKLNLEQAQASLSSELQVMSMLENELLKVIRGTSALKPETLIKKHDDTELAIAEKKAIVENLEAELANSQETMRQIALQHKEILTWADMYAKSPMDVKKMIVSQLINSVHVSRDYEIEIKFKISERQLGLDKGNEAEQEPKRKKHRNEPEL